MVDNKIKNKTKKEAICLNKSLLKTRAAHKKLRFDLTKFRVLHGRKAETLDANHIFWLL